MQTSRIEYDEYVTITVIGSAEMSYYEEIEKKNKSYGINI